VIGLCNLEPEARPQLWAPLARSMPEGDRWFLEALGIAAHEIWDECLASFEATLDSDSIRLPLTDDILWRSRSEDSAGLIARRIRHLAESLQSDPGLLARWFRALDFQDSDQVSDEVQTLLGREYLRSLNPSTSAFVANEALRRLDPKQLSEDNSSVRDALNTTLGFVQPDQRIDLIHRFRMTRRYPELLRAVVRTPSSQAGISALKYLVRLSQRKQLVELLLGDSPVSAVAVLTAIGHSRNGAFKRELLGLIDNEEADLSVRRAAIRTSLRIKTMIPEIVGRTKDNDISSELRQSVAAAMHGSADQELRKLAQQLFPLPAAKAGETLPTLNELIDREGDAKRGRLVFNTTGTCHKCHVVNRIGRHLGPDLSEIGSKLSRQAMLESVLFPSAGISHNYDSWTVVLTTGITVTGLILSETDDSVTVIDNEAIRHEVAADEIEERIRQPVSLMPEDLQKIMTTQELVDVVTYLRSLKKAVP